MRAWLLALVALLVGCAPARGPVRTHGDLTIELREGARIEQSHVVALHDMLHAARRCMRPSEVKRNDMPHVVVIGNCQRFYLHGYGPVAGTTRFDAREIWLSGSLWAGAHEAAWHYWPERIKPEPAKGEDLCGDVLGRTFRDRLPVRDCDL